MSEPEWQSARRRSQSCPDDGLPVIAIAGYIDDQLDLNELRSVE